MRVGEIRICSLPTCLRNDGTQVRNAGSFLEIRRSCLRSSSGAGRYSGCLVNGYRCGLGIAGKALFV